MRRLLTILLIFIASVSLYSQQFNYMLYERTNSQIRESYRKAGIKLIAHERRNDRVYTIYFSPIKSFIAIGYEFSDDTCISIRLYLQSDKPRHIRRLMNSDTNIKRIDRNTWMSKDGMLKLKIENLKSNKLLYLECIKVIR